MSAGFLIHPTVLLEFTLGAGKDVADALVDIWYYSLNAAAKKGVMFDIVQAANMAMKDPVTDTFLKREDGKIIKPPFTAGLF